MAKGTNRSLVLGTLVAGATMYLSKPENREKAMAAFNLAKERLLSMKDDTPSESPIMTKAGHPDPEDIRDNKMVSEGAMTSVQYYNETVQDNLSAKEKRIPPTE